MVSQRYGHLHRAPNLFLFHALLAVYQHFAFTYWPQLPHYGDRSGDPKWMVFGGVLLTSFLGLFVKFYVQTYTKGDRMAKDKDSIQLKVRGCDSS